jgi:hypothetical protein
MISMLKPYCISALFLLCWLVSHGADAHHVLGRPAYSLNEDSNTPPGMSVEIRIGDFFVTYMVFPAFPRADQPGRINLYATRVDNGATFDGEVSFSARDNRWFGEAESELLGRQKIDDAVYRQGFLFKRKGSYIIRAHFDYDGEPYDVVFPLQVGQTSPIGPVGSTVALLLLILLGVNVFQRKRLQRSKIRSAHQ